MRYLVSSGRAAGLGALLVTMPLAALAQERQADPAPDQSLGAAVLECAEIKPLFDRLRCYDRLARDVDTFDAVVRETCGTSATGRLEDPALEEARLQQSVQGAVAALRQGQLGAAPPQQLEVRRNVKVEGIDLTPNWTVDEVRDGQGVLVEVRLSTVASNALTEGGAKPSFNILCRQRNTLAWFETGLSGGGGTTPVSLVFGGDAEPMAVTLDNTQNGKAIGVWNKAETILQPLLDKKAMSVRFTPEGADKPVAADFNLNGFENAIEVIRLQCGW
ncbi:hypothetical protein ACFOGJ_26945 [Marinibaculum pumilum]|uniref:Uncharacterized protein n=1 Tax=Marinibaculum pumilum TaxID=1766165 RepID=A0ABV7L9J9_9PROT